MVCPDSFHGDKRARTDPDAGLMASFSDKATSTADLQDHQLTRCNRGQKMTEEIKKSGMMETMDAPRSTRYDDAPFGLAGGNHSITVNRNVRPRQCRVRPSPSLITMRFLLTRRRTLDRHIGWKPGHSMSSRLLAAEAAQDLCDAAHNSHYSSFHPHVNRATVPCTMISRHSWGVIARGIECHGGLTTPLPE